MKNPKSVPFTSAASLSWMLACNHARRRRQRFINPEHLLLGILNLWRSDVDTIVDTGFSADPPESVVEHLCTHKDEQALLAEIFAMWRVDHEILWDRLTAALQIGDFDHPRRRRIPLSASCRRVFETAHALRTRDDGVSSLHLLAALLTEPDALIGEAFDGMCDIYWLAAALTRANQTLRFSPGSSIALYNPVGVIRGVSGAAACNGWVDFLEAAREAAVEYDLPSVFEIPPEEIHLSPSEAYAWLEWLDQAADAKFGGILATPLYDVSWGHGIEGAHRRTGLARR